MMKCKCSEDWCSICNPPEGPIDNDPLQSGLAQREKMGNCNTGINKVKLNKDDDVFDNEERVSGVAGPVF